MYNLTAGIKIFDQGSKKYAKSFGSFLLFIALAIPSLLPAQTPLLNTEISRKEILIGQPFNLKISATYDPSLGRLSWFNLPDSIPHFEFLSKGKLDTVRNGNNVTISQSIELTSFDSGTWLLPGLNIHFGKADERTHLNSARMDAYFTDSLPVKVSYQPDTTQSLRDIKPIWEVKVFDPFWWYVAGGILLAILLAIGIIIYLKKRKKRPAPIFNSKLSAYEEAKKELDKLRAYDLNLPADVKQFHNALSDIFRRYASRKMEQNLMTKTSSDILVELNRPNFGYEQVTKVAAALRSGDAVKFAKYLPPVYESESCISAVTSMIDSMENPGANKTTGIKS